MCVSNPQLLCGNYPAVSIRGSTCFQALFVMTFSLTGRFQAGRWLLNRLPLKLANVQVMVEPASIEQRLMRALLDDLAVVDDHHLICLLLSITRRD